MKQKLQDVSKLLAAKTYILITEKEAMLAGDLKGLPGFMKIHTMQGLIRNANRLLKAYINEDQGSPVAKKKGGANNGRK